MSADCFALFGRQVNRSLGGLLLDNIPQGATCSFRQSPQSLDLIRLAVRDQAETQQMGQIIIIFGVSDQAIIDEDVVDMASLVGVRIAEDRERYLPLHQRRFDAPLLGSLGDEQSDRSAIGNLRAQIERGRHHVVQRGSRPIAGCTDPNAHGPVVGAPALGV